MAYLIGMSGQGQGRRFEIQKDRTSIGRNPGNDIVLDDAAVSSQHCYIARSGNRYLLHDLNSTNGTCVNFEKITEVELKPKQVLQIGSSELMFDDDQAESAPAASTAAEVVVEAGAPAAAQKSFSSVSPFGARRRDTKTIWLITLVIVGVLTITGFVVLLIKILR